MKNVILCLSITMLLIGCDSDNLPDVIKTQSGLHGSGAGQFLIDFPGKPKVTRRHFQADQIEFDEFVFQYRVANEHLYNVSYADYPENFLKSWDVESLFDQCVKNISSQIDDFKIVDRNVDDEKKFEKSITYVLSALEPSNETFMKARLIKNGQRIYFIHFTSFKRQPNMSLIDEFIDSFRVYLIKKKKS